MFLPDTKKRNNCLVQFSKQYKGIFEDGSFGKEYHFNIKNNEYIIRYDNDAPDEYINSYAVRGGQYYTDFILKNSIFDYKFKINSQSFFEKVFNIFKFNRIKLGNNSFDKIFYIESELENQIKIFLKDQKYQLLLKIFRLNNNKYIIFQKKLNYLWLRINVWIIDPIILKTIFDDFVQLN